MLRLARTGYERIADKQRTKLFFRKKENPQTTYLRCLRASALVTRTGIEPMFPP